MPEENRMIAARKERKTIMICEDEKDLLHLYKIGLQPVYNVLTSTSGKECISKFIDQEFEGSKIDALLLDYKLEDMQGDIVAQKVREVNSTVKIIFISAYDLDEKILKGLRQANIIADVIIKPVSVRSILNALDTHLSNQLEPAIHFRVSNI